MSDPISQPSTDDALGGEGFDPITFSVLLSRFNSIVEEMSLVLARSAATSILAVGNDYSCALYDSRDRQICMFDSAPVHTMSMHLILKEIAADFRDSIADGDVFLCNHPYRGNTHIGDLVAATPIFVDGEHRFWAMAKGHQLDVGAANPSSVGFMTREIWEEGFHIPPLKIVEGGVEREDVVGLYLSNVRFPELIEVDLRAQIGAITRGRQRLVELAGDYGVGELDRYVEEMFEYAGRRMTDHVRSWPDGEAAAEIWIDSDGGDRVDIPIRVKVTIDGDRVDVDYTGSAEQLATATNGTRAVAEASGALPFMYYIDADIPHNQGCFDHINVIAPVGTVCQARYPASTTVATNTPSDQMHDAVNRAMAQVLPDLVPAGGARGGNLFQISGVDGRTGAPWAAFMFNNGGGSGAAKGADGWPLIGTIAGLGCLRSMPIEHMELLYPLKVETMEIETDSMGMGRWNGGPGIRFSVVPTHGGFVAVTMGDGFSNPPHGVLGGTPGIGGGQYVEPLEGGPRTFVSCTGFFEVEPGHRRMGISTGGGGYGRPIERDVERVRRDVRDGIVSRAAAHDVFGVVLSADRDPAVDVDATVRRRAELSEVVRPLVDPQGPGASTWRAEKMREGDRFFLNPVLR